MNTDSSTSLGMTGWERNKEPHRKQRGIWVAVDLRATVGKDPRSEIAGYQLHAASGGEFTLRD